MKVIYCGFFLEKETLAKNFAPKLKDSVDFPHVTTAFRPSGTELHEEMLGEKIIVRAIAYGNDNTNEGIKVEFVSGSAKAQAIFETIALPHITISFAEGAKPVDTAKLSFSPLEQSVEFELHYGWYCAEKERRASIYYGGQRLEAS